MEPRIQYARSADGTSIAFATLGKGIPLVATPRPTTLAGIEADFQIQSTREAIERLAQSRMFVRIDARGRGLSDHDVEDLTLDALVADVASVIDALGAQRVDLLGAGRSPVAIA